MHFAKDPRATFTVGENKNTQIYAISKSTKKRKKATNDIKHKK